MNHLFNAILFSATVLVINLPVAAQAKITFFSREDALSKILNDNDFKKETVKIPSGLALSSIHVSESGAAPKQEYEFEFSYSTPNAHMGVPTSCSIAAKAVSKVKRMAGITSSSLEVVAIESNCAH